MPSMLRTSALAFTLALSHGPAAQAGTFRLQLLHASDLEGGVEAIGDAPRFAAVVAALEAAAEADGIGSILLSAGDNYLPGPFFNAAGDRSLRDTIRDITGNPDAREGVGRIDITIMNLLGFDASAVGNHEFDAGPSILASIIGTDIRDGTQPRWLGAGFPYLSSNLDFSGEGALSGLATDALLPAGDFFSPLGDLAAAAAAPKLAQAAIVDVDNESVGIIGATTQAVASISSVGGTAVIGPDENDMPALAAIIQPQVDRLGDAGITKVVLVSHLQQLTLETELAGLLDGVDIIVAGGSDTLLADATDRLRAGDEARGPYPLLATDAVGDPVVIVSTAGQYAYVGRLVVEFDADGRVVADSIDEDVSGAYPTDAQGVVDTGGDLDAAPAATVAALTAAVETIVTERDGIIAGDSAVFLEGRRGAVRTQETNLGNLTADANLAAARAIDSSVAVSLKNGGGIRAEIGAIDGDTGELGPTRANPASGKAAGEISQLDIEGSLRFDNGLTLLTLSAEGLLEVLEHAVAESGDGATPGRFPQVAGLAFSFDTRAEPGSRIGSAAVVDAAGNVVDLLVEGGELVGDPARAIRVVTLGFLAGGGDGYPYPDLASDVEDTGIGEQQALFEFLAENHAVGDDSPFARAETPAGADGRIQQLDTRSDTVGAGPQPTAGTRVPAIELIGRLDLGGEDKSEIAAYDPRTRRLFVTNPDDAGVQIVDLLDPTQPVASAFIDLARDLAEDGADVGPNSVAVNNRCLVAVAVERETEVDGNDISLPGVVAFYSSATGRFLGTETVGFLPDMLTFTRNGRTLLVANEGEPDDVKDPEGTVSILDVRATRNVCFSGRFDGHAALGSRRRGPVDIGDVIDTRTVTFNRFDRRADRFRRAGVRLFGDGTLSQDVEPEFIAVSRDGRTAWVTLQENNAVAAIDVEGAFVKRLRPLGTKDWRETDAGLDASDRDGGINLARWPLHGLYQPDTIASFRRKGVDYYILANEGDARDEDERIEDLSLDPDAFPDAEALQAPTALGRLQVSSVDGDTDGDGDFDRLFSYGGRSFSIWQARPNGVPRRQIHDSGSELELITANAIPGRFNSNGTPETFDGRSDNKGPEPEGLAVGRVERRQLAIVGLERAGGFAIYDVHDPHAPEFVEYVPSAAGDRSPEGLLFIDGYDSPTGNPLLVVTHEVSGTLAVYEWKR